MNTKNRTLVMVMAIAVVYGLSITAVMAEVDVVVDEFIDIPDDKLEVITVEPAWDYVWIPGSWDRDPDTWTWIKGRWEKPPHKKARWVEGHWNVRGD